MKSRKIIIKNNLVIVKDKLVYLKKPKDHHIITNNKEVISTNDGYKLIYKSA